MKILIVIGIVLVPAVMVLFRWMSARMKLLIDALGLVSAFGSGILTAFAVFDIRQHNTVYETEVHRVFDSMWFMGFSSYLGLYLLARLLWDVLKAYREEDD
ncbi:hypothetical protein ACFFNY_07615 [Paenibacillus hodogayensis]|uniref:Transposase n=1 Tax=Paenibacillus hodogayensis TaxID=279208 RepID=A0ABV5VT92_9BACL